MLLDGDEKTVYQEHKILMNGSKHTGTLILTNKRVVLETLHIKRSKIPIIGKDKKEEFIVFTAPLTEVMKVDVVKKLIGKPTVFKLGHSGKETQFTVADPSVWQNQIIRAKSEMGSHHSYGVNVNLTAPAQSAPAPSPTHTIERQVVKVRCKYCGGLYDEVAPKCPSCGAKG